MTDAAKILKGYRNHRKLGEARDIALMLSLEHQRPIHINEQTPKHITTSDGRDRTTFAGWYLSLTKGEQTIESAIPEGWVEPEVDETGRLAKEAREEIASVAKSALADAADALVEALGEEHEDQVRTMLATWARRIPGEAWDDRLPQA
jgi:hypothetical protein